jgi:hypothetical protein
MCQASPSLRTAADRAGIVRTLNLYINEVGGAASTVNTLHPTPYTLYHTLGVWGRPEPRIGVDAELGFRYGELDRT